MVQNDSSFRENDHLDEVPGTELITRAIQTDQENANEAYNNSCDKSNRFCNKTLQEYLLWSILNYILNKFELDICLEFDNILQIIINILLVLFMT